MVICLFDPNGLSREQEHTSVKHLVGSWWCHQMETFSALLALCAGNSPVTGEFPTQRPVARSFYVFFDLRVDKRLSKQSRGWWFGRPPSSLWRHCNVYPKFYGIVSICSCTESWSFAFFDLYGLVHGCLFHPSIGWNAYPRNCWIDLLRSKFYGVVSTCSWAAKHVISPFGSAYGCPFDPYGLVHRPKCAYLKLWVDFLRNSMELTRFAVVQPLVHLPIWPI